MTDSVDGDRGDSRATQSSLKVESRHSVIVNGNVLPAPGTYNGIKYDENGRPLKQKEQKEWKNEPHI